MYGSDFYFTFAPIKINELYVMNGLLISPDDFSPSVVFDPAKNVFEISGKAILENSTKFFNPVLQWLEDYKNTLCLESSPFDPSSLRIFKFNLDCLNCTSVKAIRDILIQLDKMAEAGNNIQVKWHYNKLDEDMKELGNVYLSLLKKLPFSFSEN